MALAVGIRHDGDINMPLVLCNECGEPIAGEGWFAWGWHRDEFSRELEPVATHGYTHGCQRTWEQRIRADGYLPMTTKLGVALDQMRHNATHGGEAV